MKNKIRTPTSRRRKRRVVAFLSVFLCFLYLTIGTSASETDGPVFLSSLPAVDLSVSTYTASLASYFSSSPGFIAYSNEDNLRGVSHSPDYRTGAGFDGSDVVRYLRFYQSNGIYNVLGSTALPSLPDGQSYLFFIIVRSSGSFGYSVPGYELLNGINRNMVDGSILSLYMVQFASVTNEDTGIAASASAGSEISLASCGVTYGDNTHITQYISNVKTYFDLIADNYAKGGGVNMTALLTEIVQLLFGGLTGAATALGQGANTFVTSLFVAENNSLATYGGLVVIFAGVALAIGFTTRIFTWLTSLGN